MRISELIDKLNDIRNKEGDLGIWVENEDLFESYYPSTLRSLDDYRDIHTGYVFENDEHEDWSTKRTIHTADEASPTRIHEGYRGKALILGCFYYEKG